MQKNTIHIGQKIIYTKPVNNKIIIQVDKPALRRFSYIILVALGLIAYRTATYGGFDMTNLTILLVGLIPFIMYTVYYYYTRTNSTWYVDLNEKKFYLGSVAVPFFMIDALQVTRKEKTELSVETKDKKRLVLFSDTNETLIRETALFLSSISGTPLRNR